MSSQNRAVEVPSRWERRPLAAWTVRALIFVLPLAAGVGAAWVASLALPPTTSAGEAILQWALLVGISLSVLLMVDLASRRLLPLTTLLRLSILFPGRAPSRFRVALRTGNVRGLERRLTAARDNGDEDLVQHAELVLALATSISGHDRKTRGHSERVRAYAELIAEEMGLAREDREKLRWAALLHDVGKLAVPADVLNKDGRPDEQEWAILKAHPEAGARIAGPLLDWLAPWGDTIAQHHERVDGAGYPRGLEGDDICLGARIVSVADAYETMTSARSYKQPVSPAAARAELAACAGSQFDPEVVRLFMNVSVADLRHVMAPLTAVLDVPFVRSLSGIGEPVMTGATTALFVTTLTLGGGTAPSTAPPAEADAPSRGERQAAADADPIRIEVSHQTNTAERRATPEPQAPAEPDPTGQDDASAAEPRQPGSAPSGNAAGDQPTDSAQVDDSAGGDTSTASIADTPLSSGEPTGSLNDDEDAEDEGNREESETEESDEDSREDSSAESEEDPLDGLPAGPPDGLPPGPPDGLPPGPPEDPPPGPPAERPTEVPAERATALPTSAPPVEPPANSATKASSGG